MDELNDLIAAMPDGATLTLEEGATYELSGSLRVLGKRGLTVRLNGAIIHSPHCLHLDFTGSRDCRIDCDGATFVIPGRAPATSLAVQEPENEP